MLLGALATTLLGNTLTEKGVIWSSEGIIWTGEHFLCHPIVLKYENIIKINLKFNDVYSKNNLPKIKDGAYIINLD